MSGSRGRWTAWTAFLLVAFCAAYGQVLVAKDTDDPLKPGSVWVGLLRKETPPDDRLSSDARLIIKTRKNSDFTGEIWLANDTCGVAIEGRISRDKIAWTFMKYLKGSVGKDVLGNIRFQGVVKPRTISCKWWVVATNRSGNFAVRLQEEESAKPKSSE